MPQRLPTVGSDDGTWGTLLNNFLSKEHEDVNPGTLDADSGRHQKVTIKAGTTAAGTAPLKFNSGSLLTSPEAGAMEFLTDGLYFTITTGAARKTIAFTDSNITGTAANVTGTVAIANGGTGQTGQTAAFDALAPTTTQGDIIYHNGSDNVRLAKGTASQVLTMNAGATAPEWQSPSTVTLSNYTESFLLGGM